MSVSSLRQVVSGSFVSNLSKVGKNSASNELKSLKGKGEALDVSLRNGAKNFGQGIQALNVAISYINVSRATNERMLNIVDKLELLVVKASKGTLGAQGGEMAQVEFQHLARDFQKELKGSTIRGEDVLNLKDLSSILVRAGLDPEKVEGVSEALDGFSSLDSPSSDAQDGEPLPASTSQTRLPVDTFARGLREVAGTFGEALQEGEETGGGIGTFKEVRDRLKAVRATLKGNVDALKRTSDVIGKNMALARATGLALLDLSGTVSGSEKPEDIADALQRLIRKAAPQALSQAGNLNSILVAGLTLTNSTFSSK